MHYVENDFIYEVNKIVSLEYLRLFHSKNDKQMWSFIIVIITIGSNGNITLIAPVGWKKKKDKNLAGGVQINVRVKNSRESWTEAEKPFFIDTSVTRASWNKTEC